MDLALIREFKETVAGLVHRATRFREALFSEALNAYLAGEGAQGKAMLRDLINATSGVEELGATLQVSSKSLHRMLSSTYPIVRSSSRRVAVTHPFR
ncbi:MAG: hypothetical protein P0120_08795 [Nitrospira sp.]|nr:hypothetical protein [Nitrospira sp.]